MPEVEIDPDDEFHAGTRPEPNAAKLAALREATNDPLFQADLQDIAEDFKNPDADGDEE